MYSLYQKTVSKLEDRERECQKWMERAESLEEIVRDKDELLDSRDSELSRLRFLIGAREGELASLQQSANRGAAAVSTNDRTHRDQLAFAYAGSPYFNEIDSSAASLAAELSSVSDDVERRVAVVERMGAMVAGLERLASEQHARQVASRRETAARAAQTECAKVDMVALCCLDGSDEEGEEGEEAGGCDPAERHRTLMELVHRRPCLRGVPRALRGCVGDSRAWLAARRARPAAPPADAAVLGRRLLAAYFAKMDADRDADAARAPRAPLADAVYEQQLAQLGRRSLCDTAMLELVADLRAHAASSPRARLFARFLGVGCPPGPAGEGSGEAALGVETLSVVLEVLFALHEEVCPRGGPPAPSASAPASAHAEGASHLEPRRKRSAAVTGTPSPAAQHAQWPPGPDVDSRTSARARTVTQSGCVVWVMCARRAARRKALMRSARARAMERPELGRRARLSSCTGAHLCGCASSAAAVSAERAYWAGASDRTHGVGRAARQPRRSAAVTRVAAGAGRWQAAEEAQLAKMSARRRSEVLQVTPSRSSGLK